MLLQPLVIFWNEKEHIILHLFILEFLPVSLPPDKRSDIKDIDLTQSEPDKRNLTLWLYGYLFFEFRRPQKGSAAQVFIRSLIEEFVSLF